MISMETNQATSVMDFCRSMSKKYEMLANAPCNVTHSDRIASIDDHVADMHDMNKRGMTLSQIASKYKINPVTVTNRLRSRGYDIHYNSGGQRA